MANNWQEYQEEVAQFFRSLGLEATTNFTIRGVRTSHDVDVFVKSHYVGFDIIWIVECKRWKTPVTKLHVLALREIVADVGADRGILLSETGFQSGAVEAASLTNVHVSSLANLRTTASTETMAMRLREVFDRVETCKERYWELDKDKRIEYGLRPDVGEAGYSGNLVSDVARELMSKTLRGSFPFELDCMAAVAIAGCDGRQFSSVDEVLTFLEPMLVEFETKLTACETGSK